MAAPMTVIAYRAGVLAADTAAWHNDVIVVSVRKIVRLDDGSLFAATGPSDKVAAYIAWANGAAEKPADADEESGYSGIRLYPDGEIWAIGRNHERYQRVGEFMALGAHCEFLYGAMAAGASAEEAVRLAIRYCAFASGEVQVERLEFSAPAP